jgi:hypothetical protein
MSTYAKMNKAALVELLAANGVVAEATATRAQLLHAVGLLPDSQTAPGPLAEDDTFEAGPHGELEAAIEQKADEAIAAGVPLAEAIEAAIGQVAEGEQLSPAAEAIDEMEAELAKIDQAKATVVRWGNGVRNARELRAACLLACIAAFGPDRIPAPALEAVGFAKSAWTHGPYWKASGPGSVAAWDINAIASLHRTKGGTWLSLRPVAGKEMLTEHAMEGGEE